MHPNFVHIFPVILCAWVYETRLNKREDAIRLTRWGPLVHLSPGFISDIKHWRGRPANDEAISITGLRVGARQALYYQQRSLFRALLTLHHCLVVSIGSLVKPNPAFSHILTRLSQREMIKEASQGLKLGSKRWLNIPPRLSCSSDMLLNISLLFTVVYVCVIMCAFCEIILNCRPSEWRHFCVWLYLSGATPRLGLGGLGVCVILKWTKLSLIILDNLKK